MRRSDRKGCRLAIAICGLVKEKEKEKEKLMGVNRNETGRLGGPFLIKIGEVFGGGYLT